jgi:hypothetical protein
VHNFIRIVQDLRGQVNDGMEVVEAPTLSINAEVKADDVCCPIKPEKETTQPSSDDVVGLIGNHYLTPYLN